MSEIQAHATGLASQYIAQVTVKLERNVKEQERISAEIAALQEQLGAFPGYGVVEAFCQASVGRRGCQADSGSAGPPRRPMAI
ncbi:hypothetical protein OG930_44675 [Streptomyces sp. NBC_01799]|uniref:hypothetical protein n=1 Tax=Streptomyces sp. NBC_01800 TaxID=2975945 RepID=UPI002DD9BD8A|nr:hypothetical protein [Streptomyces sp. NBC_01800]WSA74133.1 hypothetical protein OIE65_00815 [Streptomyces sp. NBC_01800]WSA74174.1 hypothetical protein OIE65_45245 [Streptomyces sp. NBC_01800]WSA82649.1 hypothetical protein OG930_00785 [Streptomyces sp. NBC_01799]WSA82680.1 hypothetical protein OG930_44675 [Streptomyces sp. NBC_01799]